MFGAVHATPKHLSCGTLTRSKRSNSKFKIVGVLDTHDPKAMVEQKLCYLMHRSDIVEVASSENLIFILNSTGICTAFDRFTMKRVCFLNISVDQVIRSLFYNKTNDSIITVSVFRTDSYSSLKCRSIPLVYVKQKEPKKGFELFENEPLKWPGFVEFDDVNGKVLTYSDETKIYKIWELKNYEIIYEILGTNIQEIKISPGIMMIIHKIEPGKNSRMDNRFSQITNSENVETYNSNDTSGRTSFLPLKLVDVANGKLLKQFKIPMKDLMKIEVVELFDEKLLLKQSGEKLMIYDVRDDSHLMMNFKTPSAFIFLYEKKLFLTFDGRKISVWNLRGDKIHEFDDHELFMPDCNTNCIHITRQQDTIISYCRRKPQAVSEGSPPMQRIHDNTGAIHFSNVLTGSCLTKISITDAIDPATTEMYRSALRTVSSLHYDENNHELYTGNGDGKLYVWSV